MHVTISRRTFVSCVLLSCALAAAVTFRPTVADRASAADRSVAAASARFPDDAHVVAAVPTRAGDWALGQPRAPHGSDLVAVVLAGSVLAVAEVRRRVARVAPSRRVTPTGYRSGIRGPPAFA